MHERGLIYDWTGAEPAPGPGDVLATVRRRDGKPTGTLYLILTARRVRRRQPALSTSRWAYRVVRIEGFSEGVRVEGLAWNPR